MAKKKVIKKHKFKHAGDVDQPSLTSVAANPATEVTPASRTMASSTSSSAIVVDGRYAYVGRDTRRISVMLAGLTVVELILWWVFTHTALGPTVYNFFRV